MGRDGSTFADFDLHSLEDSRESIRSSLRRFDDCVEHSRLHHTHHFRVRYAGTIERASKNLESFVKNLEEAVELAAGSPVDHDRIEPLDDKTLRLRRRSIAVSAIAVLVALCSGVTFYEVHSRSVDAIRRGNDARIDGLHQAHASEIERITEKHTKELAKMHPILTPRTDAILAELPADDPIVIAFKHQTARLSEQRDHRLAAQVRKMIAERNDGANEGERNRKDKGGGD